MLRFDTVPGSTAPVSGVVGGSLGLAGATLAATSGSPLFIYSSGDFGLPTGGGFCAIVTGFVCKGRLTLTFQQPVFGLTLNAFLVGPGDQSRISAFAGSVLLSTVVVRQNGLIDFSALQGVTRVTFSDESARFGTGIAYGDFRFTVQPPPVVTPVPLPPAGAMILASLALLAGRASVAGKRGAAGRVAQVGPA
jgi:hypothetical protein